MLINDFDRSLKVPALLVGNVDDINIVSLVDERCLVTHFSKDISGTMERITGSQGTFIKHHVIFRDVCADMWAQTPSATRRGVFNARSIVSHLRIVTYGASQTYHYDDRGDAADLTELYKRCCEMASLAPESVPTALEHVFHRFENYGYDTDGDLGAWEREGEAFVHQRRIRKFRRFEARYVASEDAWKLRLFRHSGAFTEHALAFACVSGGTPENLRQVLQMASLHGPFVNDLAVVCASLAQVPVVENL